MKTEKSPFSCQRDGFTIRGHVWDKAQPGKHAVIVSHGFLANEKTVHDYAIALAGEGFLAVTFDFNGGGVGSRSDGKPVDMTLLAEKADLLLMIGVGVVFLGLYLLLALNRDDTLFLEILSVIGSFSLWEAANCFLVERRDINREMMETAQFLTMEIQMAEDEKQTKVGVNSERVYDHQGN